MDTHDPHSSFIKTPQQLIAVVAASFIIPIFGIVLLVQLVTSERGADPNALTPEAVAARIQPIGRVEFGAGGGGAAGGQTGEQIVKGVCATCHQAGVAGAPKIGDKTAWAPRIKEGFNALVKDAIKGKGAMPPKGGNPALSDDDVARAVAFMANQAGASFKEPAIKAAAQKPAAATAAAAAAGGAADGKKVYDSTCTACHAAGILVQSSIKGKGAMPPKGGNASLSDADLRAAIEYMVSQAK